MVALALRSLFFFFFVSKLNAEISIFAITNIKTLENIFMFFRERRTRSKFVFYVNLYFCFLFIAKEETFMRNVKNVKVQ